MSLENKEIVRNFYQQVVNGGNLEMLETFLSPDYVEPYNPAASGHGGIDIFQILDGKIIARWNLRDIFGLMQQIGPG